MWNIGEVDSDAAAKALLARVAADDWGQVAVSLYDTARLVALAPWLAGHQARLEFLLSRQHPTGGWGGPDGYALVPTLSATAALLAEVHRGVAAHERDRLVRAASGSLAALRQWIAPPSGLDVPDTIGAELIIPALVDELNRLLTGIDDPLPQAAAGPLPQAAAGPLPLPHGFDRRTLHGMLARLDSHALPQRAWACLEVLGDRAVAAPFVRPAAGAVGCSAAATAAWLGGPGGDRAGIDFLDQLQRRGGGPVPGVTPITYFEPAWVLNSLALGGFACEAPAAILDRLETGLTPQGVPAGVGLPADGDDTAAVLAALLRHGRVHAPDSLLGFQVDGYFTTFLDERNPSISTNAHVLEALALYARHRPQDGTRFAGAAGSVARWLLDHQHADGSWWDKWHASPYYATACCVLALMLHGIDGSHRAIERATAWVMQAQRPDGSWGRWQGTVEETSYAVQILAMAGGDGSSEAIKRGRAFLADPPPLAEHPPLWHAKDLYTPVAVIQAARMAAMRMTDPSASSKADSNPTASIAGM